jgi:hypothetical protein
LASGYPLKPKAFKTIRKPGKVLALWDITLFTSNVGFAKFNSNPCSFNKKIKPVSSHFDSLILYRHFNLLFHPQSPV